MAKDDKNEMVTLKTIAQECGVSVNTVSRALNGQTKATKASTGRRLAKIKECAQRMGYRPNLTARAMRQQRTYQVGLLGVDLSNPISAENIEAYSVELAKHGYKILLGLSRGEPDVLIDDFAAGIVDGVINMDPTIETQKLLDRFDVPVVSPLRDDHTSPVQLNYSYGIELAMQHLWDMGHRKIGYISGPAHNNHNPRLEAYENFLDKKSVKRHPAWSMSGAPTKETGEQLAPKLWQAGCTAIMCFNDALAVGVITAAHEHDLNVPSDLSVIGFDNSVWATIVVPPLTTVWLPVQDIVRITVNSLMMQITNQSNPDMQYLKPELIVRRSTAPAPK